MRLTESVDNLVVKEQASHRRLPPMDRRTEATRVQLIRAGERLLGEQGIESVALRNICEAAGQKNNASVQYHFGGRMQLLRAIFEYRENQLEPMRRAFLEDIERQGATGDVKSLLRVMYEPLFLLYRDADGVAYLRLLANYLLHQRPGGVEHPTDISSPSSASYRRAKKLLMERMDFLGKARLYQRIETIGAMFLSAMLQHSERDPAQRECEDTLMADTFEMMVAALCALPGLASPAQQSVKRLPRGGR